MIGKTLATGTMINALFCHDCCRITQIIEPPPFIPEDKAVKTPAHTPQTDWGMKD